VGAPGLLARHRDADSILRRDEVVHVLGGVSNGELDALNSAVKSVAARAVIWGLLTNKFALVPRPWNNPP
jgi:hypothetical protein